MSSRARTTRCPRLMLAALGIAALLLSACTVEHAYQRDARVEILSPEDRQRVDLPVQIRWRVEDFEITAPAWRDGTVAASGGREADPRSDDDRGYFAVFVDRTPIPPGAELMSVAAGDTECTPLPSCPDVEYLANNGVHVTTSTELTLSTLVDRRSHDRANDWHEVTIVLVEDNKAGTGEVGEARRVGAAAFSVRFVVDRPK